MSKPDPANTVFHYSDPKHTPYGASASGSLADLYGFDSPLLNNASGIGMWMYVGLVEQIIRGGWGDNIEVHVISGTGQKGIFMLQWGEVPRGTRIKDSVLYKRPNFDEKRWEHCITDAVF